MLLRNQPTNSQPGLLKVPAQKTSTSALRSNNPPVVEPERNEQIIRHAHCRHCGSRRNDIYRPSLGLCTDCLGKDIDNNDKELFAEPIFVKGGGTDAI